MKNKEDNKTTINDTKKTYYITTPIYYPSGQWHIGHCYTSINCDALARYYRLKGFDVCYSTGNDEHGQKIAKVAATLKKGCQEYVDERAKSILNLWQKCDVQFDRFIRTTDKEHQQKIQNIFKKLYNNGDIYKGTYSGKYCTPCESFWTDNQLIDGNCPDCGRETTYAEEECYFFRLSAYSERILKLLTQTNFLEPKSRVNEMVAFIKEGLTDLAVTRTSVEWGVKVPFDEKHTIYVWIDALSNYITLLGYDSELDNQSDDFQKFWPANLHMVGKEIVRFHAIIWPAILMALQLPLPKKIFGHGWLLLDGDKMSKSKGNVIDPIKLIDKYGVDAFRYYLLSEVPFGNDGAYTTELFLHRINTDIVNSYGNLVRRTLSMATQNFEEDISNTQIVIKEEDNEFLQLIKNTPNWLDEDISALKVSSAITKVFELISQSNKYIDMTKPWVLAKDQNTKNRLMTVLFNLLEAIRVSSALLMPFMTQGPQKVLQAIGIDTSTIQYEQLTKLGAIQQYSITPLDILYPRIDITKELKEILQ